MKSENHYFKIKHWSPQLKPCYQITLKRLAWLIAISLVFNIFAVVPTAYATNYLTNPSFTGGSTGWTLSVSTYDSTYYQDTAGSLKTATAVGRRETATGYAQQTIGTNIEAGSTVLLSHYWSKQCVAINCTTNTVQVDIAKPSTPTTWVTIWSDTSIPTFGSATSWTGPSNLDVSSNNFNETGEYIFRVYADLKNGNSTSAQALAWFDNLNLDVTPPASLGVTAPANVTLTAGNPGTTIETTFGTGELVAVTYGSAAWSLTIQMTAALTKGSDTIPTSSVYIKKDGLVDSGSDTIWSGVTTNVSETAETVPLNTSQGVGTRSSGTGGDVTNVRPTIQVVMPPGQALGNYINGNIRFTVA